MQALYSALGAECGAPPSPAHGPWAVQDRDAERPLSTWELVHRVVQLTGLVNTAERTVALALGSHGPDFTGGFDVLPAPMVANASTTTSADGGGLEEHVHEACEVRVPREVQATQWG